MAEQNQPPKIQIDDDWKAQARKEKERLAAQAKPAAAATAGATPAGGAATASGTAAPGAAAGTRVPAGPGGAGQREMPPANFQTLVSTMATQALFAFGAFPDPRTGQRSAHLELARHHIDMLSVIEEKTRNNLTEQESAALGSTLYELRQRYIQIAMAARERQ